MESILVDRLREADELRISRPPVGTDAVRLEAVLHIDLPRVIELEPPFLHNLEDLLLALVIKTGAPVAGLYVRREVKVGAREASLYIAMETIGKAQVEVVAAGDVKFGDMRNPEVSSKVEGGRDDKEEDRNAEEKEHCGSLALVAW